MMVEVSTKSGTCIEQLRALAEKTLKELDDIKRNNERIAASIIHKKTSGLNGAERALAEAMYESYLDDMRALHGTFAQGAIKMPELLEANFTKSALESVPCDLDDVDMSELVEKYSEACDFIIEELSKE